MRFCSGINNNRTITTPMFKVVKAVDAIDIICRVATRKSYPTKLLALAATNSASSAKTIQAIPVQSTSFAAAVQAAGACFLPHSC